MNHCSNCCAVLMNIHIQVAYMWMNIHLYSGFETLSYFHLKHIRSFTDSTALHIIQFLKQNLMLNFIFQKLIKLKNYFYSAYKRKTISIQAHCYIYSFFLEKSLVARVFPFFLSNHILQEFQLHV